MKAIELQLNDLVQYKGDVCHITSLDALGGLVGIANEHLIELVSESEIQPITLTVEILEKNGFGYMQPSRLAYIPDDGGCVKYDKITHYIYVSGDGTVQKNIGYVHELQHALRLCGLNDLANNFELE